MLAACGSGDSSDPSSSADEETGSAADPIELTYWTWMTNVEDIVAVWNSEHPDIQVTIDRLAEGDDLVTRTVTAAKAGNLPDIVQAEYQSLPILVSNGIVAELDDLAPDALSQYSEGVLNQVSWGDTTYAIPGDVGPLMMYVRTDLFDTYGVPVPTTWDEFAQAAAAIHAADPSVSITSFDATYPGWFAGLSQQAGAEWWTAQDNEWSVNIDDQATEKVADYWSGLLADGLVSTSPTYSAEWNTALADGTILSWIAPTWGAGVIEGIAPDTAGSWQAVPLPQWNAGETYTGLWGGSSAAIADTSTHKEAAAEFLTWLYTSDEGVQQLVDVATLYPASIPGQEYSATSATPAVLGDQTDFWQLSAESASNARAFRWSPNVAFTFATMQDAFSTAIENGTSLTDTLAGVQTASVDDLVNQGYPVAD
ncbi:extracellular solute-binding protein [Actinotalea sp. M2MS4P-6]|uniref:ABC transporter substrate-binding protein n=1 Tax=Actinotalea sp. M2MS4P-6 TaxID=2983762 RepID=UPI0021E48D6B|nr:extracellular solute-binding protein [Actinotalea sp. M2MS4P-6]MCV2395313.1 extracellular solute-binding protein [Actinotalea sp. M2MS4P-6]